MNGYAERGPRHLRVERPVLETVAAAVERPAGREHVVRAADQAEPVAGDILDRVPGERVARSGDHDAIPVPREDRVVGDGVAVASDDESLGAEGLHSVLGDDVVVAVDFKRGGAEVHADQSVLGHGRAGDVQVHARASERVVRVILKNSAARTVNDDPWALHDRNELVRRIAHVDHRIEPDGRCVVGRWNEHRCLDVDLCIESSYNRLVSLDVEPVAAHPHSEVDALARVVSNRRPVADHVEPDVHVVRVVRRDLDLGSAGAHADGRAGDVVAQSATAVPVDPHAGAQRREHLCDAATGGHLGGWAEIKRFDRSRVPRVDEAAV